MFVYFTYISRSWFFTLGCKPFVIIHVVQNYTIFRWWRCDCVPVSIIELCPRRPIKCTCVMTIISPYPEVCVIHCNKYEHVCMFPFNNEHNSQRAVQNSLKKLLTPFSRGVHTRNSKENYFHMTFQMGA